MEAREKSSEWPQFTGPPLGSDGLVAGNDRDRTATHPSFALWSGVTGTLPASVTPLFQPHKPGWLQRLSPSGMMDSAVSSISDAHSVSTTPFAGIPNTGTGGCQDHVAHLSKSSAPRFLVAESQAMNSRSPSGVPAAVNALHASFSRILAGPYSDLNFRSVQSFFGNTIRVSCIIFPFLACFNHRVAAVCLNNFQFR